MQEFLRLEFSEENAIFWKKCEEYRKSTNTAYRKQLAQLIYADHVAESSADQVNIDANVRQTVERCLSTAPVHLFDDAQRQIYLLMKYDPYPRYVKMQRCVADDVVGLLPPTFEQLEDELDCAADDNDDKERRRWSLLPNWLADRRRRTGARDESDVGDRQQPAGVSGQSGSGLTRFIKRLSYGDRKAPALPLPHRSTRKLAQPTTPSASRQQPLPPSTGKKRHVVESSEALSTRRSTSVLGLHSVSSVSHKTRTVSRPTAQRTIRYR